MLLFNKAKEETERDNVQSIPSHTSRHRQLFSRNQSSQIKTNPTKLNIGSLMIKKTLTNDFDEQVFKTIKTVTPQKWIHIQTSLAKQLLVNKKMHEKYFDTFYRNHVKLSNWHQLATKCKVDLSPYVFTQLLSKSKEEYYFFGNEKLKEVLESEQINRASFPFAENVQKHKMNNSSKINQECLSTERMSLANSQHLSQKQSVMRPKCSQELSSSIRNPNQSLQQGILKPSQKGSNSQAKVAIKTKQMNLKVQRNEIMQSLFKNALMMNQQQRKNKPLNLKLYSRRQPKEQNEENFDSHDLYMKTFDACQGRRYIFYDYEKHMKGMQEKNKYNQFLRSKVSGNREGSCTPYNSSPLNLSKFEEFYEHRVQRSKQKCSLLPMNLILKQKPLNSYQGLKNFTNRHKSSKVVFVNHQGKPITYYIRKDQMEDTVLDNNSVRCAELEQKAQKMEIRCKPKTAKSSKSFRNISKLGVNSTAR